MDFARPSENPYKFRTTNSVNWACNWGVDGMRAETGKLAAVVPASQARRWQDTRTPSENFCMEITRWSARKSLPSAWGR